MERKYIEDMLNAGPCPEGMEETIIAFAAGELNTEEERINALVHILKCESCRFTYEDFIYIEHNDEFSEEEEIPGISFRIDNNFIIPLTEHTSRSATVLSSDKSRSAEFKLQSNKTDYKINVLQSTSGTELTVDCGDDNTKFYLVGGRDYRSAFPYSGKAKFEKIKPGRYILSNNMKSFVFIEIK